VQRRDGDDTGEANRRDAEPEQASPPLLAGRVDVDTAPASEHGDLPEADRCYAEPVARECAVHQSARPSPQSLARLDYPEQDMGVEQDHVSPTPPSGRRSARRYRPGCARVP